MIKKPVLDSVFWSYSNVLWNGFFSILVIFLFSRSLNLDEYGNFVGAYLFIDILTVVGQFGISNYLIQLKNNDNRIFSTGFLLTGLISLIIILILNVCAFLFLNYEKYSLNFIPFLILTLYLPARNLTAVINAIFLRSLKNKTITLIAIVSSLLSLLIALSFLYKTNGIYALIALFVSKEWTRFILSIIYLRINIFTNLKKSSIKEMLLFGLPLTLSTIVNKINIEAPKIFCFIFLDSKSLGILSACLLIVNSIHNIFRSTTYSLWVPVLSKIFLEMPQRFGEIFIRFTNVQISIVFPLFIIIAINNYEIIEYIIPKNLQNIGYLLPYTCIYGMITSLTYLIIPSWIVLNKTVEGLKIEIIKLVIGFILFINFSSFGLQSIIFILITQELFILFYSKIKISPYIKKTILNQFISSTNIFIASSIFFIFSLINSFYLIKINSIYSFIYVMIISLLIYYLSLFVFDRSVFREYKHIFKIYNSKFFKNKS